MKRIQYAARGMDGMRREGELDAENLQDAVRTLKEQGLVPIRLREARKKKRFPMFFRSSHNQKYAAFFCRQLSVMVDEQPLNEILSALARQKGEQRYQDMLREMRDDVETGKSLADAMAKHEDVFSSGAIHLVRAGQESGNLGEILARLADFLEKQYAAGQRLGSSLVYPALLGVTSVAAATFLILYVLPAFAALFQNFGTELPLPARLLMHIGAFAADYGAALILLLPLLLALVRWLYLREPVRWRVDYALLRLPLIGQLQQQVAWMHILGTLAVEIASGIRIDAALGMVRGIPSNRFLQQCLERLQREASHGYPMARLLESCPVFPPLLLELVAAGENTGRLEEMLQKCADYCALSAENLSRRLQAMVEPAMLLALSGIVLIFVLSVVLPLLETMDQMG